MRPTEASAALAQAAIADEFAFFGDWSERYQYLIDLGRKLPPFPEDWKTEANRLHGCQSMVWIVADEMPMRTAMSVKLAVPPRATARHCWCMSRALLPSTQSESVNRVPRACSRVIRRLSR